MLKLHQRNGFGSPFSAQSIWSVIEISALHPSYCFAFYRMAWIVMFAVRMSRRCLSAGNWTTRRLPPVVYSYTSCHNNVLFRSDALTYNSKVNANTPREKSRGTKSRSGNFSFWISLTRTSYLIKEICSLERNIIAHLKEFFLCLVKSSKIYL